MKKLPFILIPMILLGAGLRQVDESSFVIASAKGGLNPNKYQTSAEVYYKDIKEETTGIPLLAQLRDLTVSNHKTFFEWEDFGNNESYMYTDKYPGKESTHFMDCYSRTPQERKWNGTKYNREHVWCASKSGDVWNRKSSVGDVSEQGGGADMHHIRPCLAGPNKSRNDDVFTQFDTAKKEPRKSKNIQFGWQLPNKQSSHYFEPLDEVKGDVARTLMYLFMHYNTPETLAKNMPEPVATPIGKEISLFDADNNKIRMEDLKITNIIVYDMKKAKSARTSFDLILEWNKLDPVDQFELNRNEAAYGLQGNRNPFVDHPEWADEIFGKDVDNSVPPETTPSEPQTPDTPEPPLPPKNDVIDEKTIIIIAAVVAIVAITLITVIILVHHNKKQKRK